ncbi:hypothetical protein HCB44_04940 [Listeria sp. FSL L7-0229]|uniref:IS630 transposase-related protein n=1 Tax=Listeria cossartiae TaxID=2838249 RepID=UPI00162326BF|nr:IS630 transposase-related protein [Listeria cossartiae]MBC2191631.1 hypothetical protein [Listeria cossartiae subsp. cossartiae]
MNNAKYNKLTIIEKTGERTKSGNLLYLCQCECGNTCTTTLAKLRSGHTKSCGCLIKDVAAKKFEKFIGVKKNRLTIIADTGNRTSDGQRMVLCQCECGEKREVVFAKFNNGDTKSCGCLALEKKMQKHSSERSAKVVATLKENNILVENTNIAVIARDTIMSTNKSGVTGVSYDKTRNRWVAQITFQGENKRLGRYIKKEDAIKARKEAEGKYFKPLIDKYSKPENKKTKIDRKKLQDYINKFPEATAKDISEHFNISLSMVYYRIRKYNLDYKKKSRNKQLDQKEFERYIKNNPDLSSKVLAEHFGVSVNAVNSHKKMLNKKVSKKVDIFILRKYIANNPDDTLEELSQRFKVNKRTMQDIIKAHNIDYKRKLASPKKLDVDELRLFIENNPDLRRKDLAERLNVSLPTIANYLKKYDLPYTPKNGRRKK